MASTLINRLYAAIRNEEGQTMAEYGLILAGIAVLVMATVFILGGEINTTFQEVVTALQA